MRRAVVICFFNRLYHLNRSIASVIENASFEEFDIYIFVDYNEDNDVKEGLASLINKYVKHSNIFWIYRESNLGGKYNWINAWTEVSNNYDYILSIEDDIVLSKVALDYCKLMEKDLGGNTLGFCLWRDKRWESVLRHDEYTRSHEFNAWGWYTGSQLLKELLGSMSDISWINSFQPSNRIEYMHLFKVLRYDFYWGDRLISLYSRMHDKKFIHSGVSLALNIGLDGSGMHSGIYEIEQESLIGNVKSLRKKILSDKELVRLKYGSNSKYSIVAYVYYCLWYWLNKFAHK